ncbi:MAG: TrkA C-terminal domain-containing protein [Candidatus Sumerlaeia bacterium]|nr:TrkA C-terminal domain-containing protein [Candidatus Sumerlaeia bacterium]
MEAFWVFFHDNPIAALLVILALGTWIGSWKLNGVSLGSSAVLFVALFFGNYGVKIPYEIASLGVVLFVYSVGLQAGPKFFKAFRSRGISFAKLALAIVSAGALTTAFLHWLFDLSPALSVGIFTGAMTTTPGLAAAMESLKDPRVSVGYGIAYPCAVILKVLFVQLMPRVLGVDLVAVSRQALKNQAGPALHAKWFNITNEQLVGRTIAQVWPDEEEHASIARLARGETILPGVGSQVLQVGDYLKAVGSPKQLEKAGLLIGPEVPGFTEPQSTVLSYTVVVTKEKFVGRALAELNLQENYGIVVTRIFRTDQEFTPQASTTLEFGDHIRIVGPKDDCERFIAELGDAERKLQETPFLPLMLGLALGVLLGIVPVPLPGGGTFSLGLAGGPLIIALLAGHYGRLGSLVFHVPTSAKVFIRELGLILFLAGAGVKAGEGFLTILRDQGFSLFFVGLLVTLVPIIVSFLLGHYLFRFDAPTNLGALCGGMTSTPGLGVVTQAAQSEYPAVAYATVYPVALIFVTLAAKLLALVLTGMSLPAS